MCRLVGGDVGDGLFEAIIFPDKKKGEEKKKINTRGLFIIAEIVRKKKVCRKRKPEEAPSRGSLPSRA